MRPGTILVAAALSAAPVLAQAGPPADPPVEKIDEQRLRVGEILVDREKGELSVGGTVTSATVLEYLATARKGFKSYESAFELDCSAVELNLALILLGLDEERGVPSKSKFDADAPQGDPVEIRVEWESGEDTVSVPAEELLYDTETGRTLSPGPWVYTGSVFLEDGTYLAEADGVLIGFMHTPESIIDSPRPLATAWGSMQRHPEASPEEGTRVKLVVRRIAEEAGK